MFGIHIRQNTAVDPIMMFSKFETENNNERTNAEWDEALLEETWQNIDDFMKRIA